MIILGIDPGLSTSGFGVMKKERGQIYLLDYGALNLSSSKSQFKSISQRVRKFFDFFEEKILKFQVNAIALETPFLGKNAQSFLKLGYLRGILYLLADIHNLQLLEFSPSQVKLSLTGFGGSQKEAVARVLLKLFPIDMPKKLDVTDALAVAFCGTVKNIYI